MYITVVFKIPALNVCLQQVQLKIEMLISHLGYEAGHPVHDAIHKRGASVALAQPHIMVASQNVVRSGSSPSPTNDPDLRSRPFQGSCSSCQASELHFATAVGPGKLCSYQAGKKSGSQAATVAQADKQ